MDFKGLFAYRDLGMTEMDAFIKEIHQEVTQQYESDHPSIGTVDKFHYYDYLKDKQLNQNPMDTREVIQDLVSLFRGMPSWANPGTMLNVIPPANLLSCAMANYVDMLNANFSQDKYTGLMMSSELEVTKYLSDLIGWDWEESLGTFTFGGKGTNLYGLRCAINRVCPEAKKSGLGNNRYFFISPAKGHPCHHEVSEWLGLGFDACVRIPCDVDGKIKLDEAEKEIQKRLSDGAVFLGFILSGGSTVEFEVDDIQEIAEMRQRIINSFQLSYRPYIHVDSVVGWPWLFFKGYDFDKNDQKIRPNVMKHIKSMYHDIEKLKCADSIGIDFHKTGYCPYISSVFIAREKSDIYLLGDKEEIIPRDELEFGNYSPFEYTLELTRSGRGPMAALAALKSLGVVGYRELLIQLMNMVDIFRNKLQSVPFITLLNKDSRGLSTLFVIKPPQFELLNLKQLLELPETETKKIASYNVDFGAYIDKLFVEGKIPFIFTATDAFAVNNTNVFLGMQKIYPMSPFTTEEYLDAMIETLHQVKQDFDKGTVKIKRVSHRPVDMVYRK